jgi:hypothetical protein
MPNPAIGSDLRGGQQDVEAGATSEVYDRLARLESRMPDRDPPPRVPNGGRRRAIRRAGPLVEPGRRVRSGSSAAS